MTPQEIQAAIEGLLSVQRNLQEGQLKNQEAIAQHSEQIALQTAQIESLRASTEGLIRVSGNLLTAQQGQQESINQLKRAVDYLLGKDGEAS
jgi:hypothetical protein